jgi:hypothetical protein
MFAGFSEMVQDFVAVAPGILEGVGQDRKVVEGFLIVDASGKGEGGGSAPGGVEGDRAEGEDVADKVALCHSLSLIRSVRR